MKSKIQDLIKHGSDVELQELLINAPLELSKGDIDKLIGAAEFTNQTNIANILQKAARSLTKDEGTQCNSLNTTGDSDKGDIKDIQLKLVHNKDVPKDSNFTQVEEWIKILKTIEDHPTYEHIMANVLEIYTKQLSYTNTVNEICSAVQGIKQNQLIFDALFNLSEAMAGFNNAINSNYKSSYEEESEIDVAGDVYDFTIMHI